VRVVLLRSVLYFDVGHRIVTRHGLARGSDDRPDDRLGVRANQILGKRLAVDLDDDPFSLRSAVTSAMAAPATARIPNALKVDSTENQRIMGILLGKGFASVL